MGGDWVNNATFTSSPGNTITFNGASIQEISGSVELITRKFNFK